VNSSTNIKYQNSLPLGWEGFPNIGGNLDFVLKIIKKGYSIPEIIGKMRREKEIWE